MSAAPHDSNTRITFLQAEMLARLLYMLLLLVWFFAVYFCLVKFQIEQFPLCWDFIHYYQCGAMALSPDRFNVYDAQVQLNWTNKLINPAHVDQLWFIQFVPFVFPLMIPIALLPLKQAYWVWCVSSAVLTLLPLAIILKERKWTALSVAGFCLGTLVCVPEFNNIWWGQFAGFYLSLIGFYFLSLRNKNDYAAGTLLALLCIKPQYIPYLLLPALASHRWKIIVVAFVTGSILLLLSIAVIGSDAVFQYPQILLSAESQTSDMQANVKGMIGLRGMLSRLPLSAAVSIGLAVILNLSFLLAFWRFWVKAFQSNNLERLNWLMALTVLAALVLNLHSLLYDCLFVALPAALTLRGFRLKDLLPKTAQFEGTNEFNKALALLVRLASIFWQHSFYLYPIVSWFIYFPLIDPTAKAYTVGFFVLNSLLLIAGLTIYDQDMGRESNY